MTKAAGAASKTKAESPRKSPGAAKTGPEVRVLSVHPRAIERPLMKYRLLPAEYELNAGNAAPILLRLAWERTYFFSTIAPKLDTYLNRPLNDPKAQEAAVFFGRDLYPELKRAAYRRTAEWEYPIGEEPVAEIRLPDIQGARQIVGRGLSVWIRHKLSVGKLAEAREGILVGLAVSRHYARTPFLVTQLVCAKIDSMMLDRLEELLSQPNSPNLYWALADLPRPFVDIRSAIELEQRFLRMSVPGLGDLDHPRTPEQWANLSAATVNYFVEVPGAKERNQDARKLVFARFVSHARAELPAWIDGGAGRVATMSDAEAALRWFLRVYEDKWQETAALMSLEPPVAIPRLETLQKRLEAFRSDMSLANEFGLEHAVAAYVTAWGIQRRIDALRIVEAIRNHAAGHEGRLPESLENIGDPPVPADPVTGRLFRYDVTNGTATLSAPGIVVAGREIGAVHYRIKVH